MMPGSNRRSFLKTALAAVGGVAGLSASSLLFETAVAKSTGGLTATRLADDMVLIAGGGGNVVVARDAQGLLLVDGGSRQYADKILKLAATELSAKPVHTLFNTHWHPDQTGANERLGKQGAKIIAHENTRLWLRSGFAPLGAGTYGPLPEKACPNETIYTTASLPFGSGQIDYGYLLQAHTDGDIYVFFREANVLVAGGAVSGAGWPSIDVATNGWIGGMVAGLKKLTTLADENTRIVPADGPVLTRAELVAQHEMYSTISGRLQKLLRTGMSPGEAVAAAPAREFEARWGNSEQFVTTAFKSLWGVMAPDA